ncbi:hypothetical protein [Tropicibacter alexandrii]|nr:hypothetical protein [Tropicibacter alexandrii]
MFRLIRLVVLLAATFVAGIVFERGQQRESCENNGMIWNRAGYCSR